MPTVARSESGSVANATSAKIHEIENMKMTTETSVTTAEMICTSVSCKVEEIRSTSLVTRERISPLGRPS